MGKKVIIIIDNPGLANPEDCLNRRTTINLLNLWLVNQNPLCSITKEKAIKQREPYTKVLSRIVALYPNSVTILDSLDYLCDLENNCGHTLNGRPLYSYTDHISDYASGLIGKDLNKLLLNQQIHMNPAEK